MGNDWIEVRDGGFETVDRDRTTSNSEGRSQHICEDIWHDDSMTKNLKGQDEGIQPNPTHDSRLSHDEPRSTPTFQLQYSSGAQSLDVGKRYSAGKLLQTATTVCTWFSKNNASRAHSDFGERDQDQPLSDSLHPRSQASRRPRITKITRACSVCSPPCQGESIFTYTVSSNISTQPLLLEAETLPKLTHSFTRNPTQVDVSPKR